jgi:DNA-binding MurR/RpiR family transcriptional regulator
MKNSILTEIRIKYNEFSPAQKIIADFILKNLDKVILLSIGDLAGQCNTSETTIMRFVRKLGYDSYQVLKVMIAQDIADSTTQSIYEEIKEDDDVRQIAKKVIFSTINSIEDLNNLLDSDTIQRVVYRIKNARRVLIFGSGSSGAIAFDAFHKFSRLGVNVVNCVDSHMMSILSAHTKSDELLIAISHSGESREILDSAELAKENGAGIVAITSYKHSTLTKHADEVIYSSTNETKYRSDAMVSRIIQLVIIDILYVTYVLNQGKSAIEALNKSRLAVAKKKI